MNLLNHIILTLILSSILLPEFGLSVLIIFIGGIIVDFDHYIAYVCKFKKFGVSKSYKFYINNYKNKNYLFVFHLIEFWAAFLLIGLFYRPVLILLIGVLFHLFLDIIDMKTHRVEWKSKFSLIYRKRRKIKVFA